MLKVRGIEAVGERARRFLIEDGGRPASEASLKLVALYARRLFAESELSAVCSPVSDGILALEIPETDTVYFYDGVVFAALDAFNNPNKNPTLTMDPAPSE